MRTKKLITILLSISLTICSMPLHILGAENMQCIGKSIDTETVLSENTVLDSCIFEDAEVDQNADYEWRLDSVKWDIYNTRPSYADFVFVGEKEAEELIRVGNALEDPSGSDAYKWLADVYYYNEKVRPKSVYSDLSSEISTAMSFSGIDSFNSKNKIIGYLTTVVAENDLYTLPIINSTKKNKLEEYIVSGKEVEATSSEAYAWLSSLEMYIDDNPSFINGKLESEISTSKSFNIDSFNSRNKIIGYLSSLVNMPVSSYEADEDSICVSADSISLIEDNDVSATYLATVKFEGKTYTDTRTVQKPIHDWKVVSTNWIGVMYEEPTEVVFSLVDEATGMTTEVSTHKIELMTSESRYKIYKATLIYDNQTFIDLKVYNYMSGHTHKWILESVVWDESNYVPAWADFSFCCVNNSVEDKVGTVADLITAGNALDDTSGVDAYKWLTDVYYFNETVKPPAVYSRISNELNSAMNNRETNAFDNKNIILGYLEEAKSSVLSYDFLTLDAEVKSELEDYVTAGYSVKADPSGSDAHVWLVSLRNYIYSTPLFFNDKIQREIDIAMSLSNIDTYNSINKILGYLSSASEAVHKTEVHTEDIRLYEEKNSYVVYIANVMLDGRNFSETYTINKEPPSWKKQSVIWNGSYDYSPTKAVFTIVDEVTGKILTLDTWDISLLESDEIHKTYKAILVYGEYTFEDTIIYYSQLKKKEKILINDEFGVRIKLVSPSPVQYNGKKHVYIGTSLKKKQYNSFSPDLDGGISGVPAYLKTNVRYRNNVNAGEDGYYYIQLSLDKKKIKARGLTSKEKSKLRKMCKQLNKELKKQDYRVSFIINPRDISHYMSMYEINTSSNNKITLVNGSDSMIVSYSVVSNSLKIKNIKCTFGKKAFNISPKLISRSVEKTNEGWLITLTGKSNFSGQLSTVIYER